MAWWDVLEKKRASEGVSQDAESQLARVTLALAVLFAANTYLLMDPAEGRLILVLGTLLHLFICWRIADRPNYRSDRMVIGLGRILSCGNLVITPLMILFMTAGVVMAGPGQRRDFAEDVGIVLTAEDGEAVVWMTLAFSAVLMASHCVLTIRWLSLASLHRG